MDVPTIKLTGDQQQLLLDVGKAIPILQANIAALERAGMDATSLKAQLAKSEQLRLGLLREFGQGG